MEVMVIFIYKIYKIDIIGSQRLKDDDSVITHKYTITKSFNYE